MATPAQPAPLKQELVEKLLAGAEVWNAWRSRNPETPLSLNSVSVTNSDLSERDLSGVDLTNAALDGTNLASANLRAAILRNASLKGVEFKDVDLLHADLRETNLQGADFSEIKGGLLPEQLSGADLTGAMLPPPLERFYEKMGSVSEISDSAQKLFLALLAACLYAWLTIGTTKDVDLITNRASSPLPIIQTAIPIVGFYVVAPMILLCIYFYFHFYLQKLWEELSSLPAVFQDGRPLHARADPWLFNDLVRAHFTKLRANRPFLSYFQQFISILLAWWLVPITLLLFWGRYLPRHDLAWTTVLALVLVISIVSAWRLYRLVRRILRGDKRLSFREALKSSSPYVTIFATILLGVASVLISRSAILCTPKGWVARAMARVHYFPVANLTEADASVKPPNWTGGNRVELEQVKGAHLNGYDLRYASAELAFLANAQLENADLTGADLQWADLRRADLGHAKLTGAKLKFAAVAFADFRYATGLDPEAFRNSLGWELAFFDDEMITKLGFECYHNDMVEDFRKSDSNDFRIWELQYPKEHAKFVARRMKECQEKKANQIQPE